MNKGLGVYCFAKYVTISLIKNYKQLLSDPAGAAVKYLQVLRVSFRSVEEHWRL